MAPLFDAAEIMSNKWAIEAKIAKAFGPIGQRIETSNRNQFRQHVYLPIIDCVIDEFRLWYSRICAEKGR